MIIRIKTFEDYLQMDLPEETRSIFTTMRDELLQNRGKGFIKQPEDEVNIPIAGDSDVEKMYIITNSGCGSSGDNFVAIFRMLPKVTVVGRPTMGILDYSNAAFVIYGDFYLMYPTSRLISLDSGNGMMKKRSGCGLLYSMGSGTFKKRCGFGNDTSNDIIFL